MMYSAGKGRMLKDLLRVFAEGSIFPLKEKKEYYGYIVNTFKKETYAVYHNGLAIPVFTRLGDEK